MQQLRLWILSDLHLEVAPLYPPLEAPEADVCVVAGDLCRGAAAGVEYLANLLGGRMACVYVPGNHEYWSSSIQDEIAAGREAAARHPDIHFLEDEVVEVHGVRFIGMTLWTDFAIFGHRSLAMKQARERMRDYRRISMTKKPWTRFTPEGSARLHDNSRSLISALGRLTDKSVIVTHHAPHTNSLLAGEESPLVDAAYASNLETLIRAVEPTLWVHGHTHLARDYEVGRTRIVSNPCGYPEERSRFDRTFTIEI